MSFNVTVSGHRFAIDGELGNAVRREKASLQHASDGGGPLTTRMVTILKTALDELLATAPHDCDISIASNGHRDGQGYGALSVKVQFLPPKRAEAKVVGAIAAAPEPPVEEVETLAGQPDVPVDAPAP